MDHSAYLGNDVAVADPIDVHMHSDGDDDMVHLNFYLNGIYMMHLLILIHEYFLFLCYDIC